MRTPNAKFLVVAVVLVAVLQVATGCSSVKESAPVSPRIEGRVLAGGGSGPVTLGVYDHLQNISPSWHNEAGPLLTAGVSQWILYEDEKIVPHCITTPNNPPCDPPVILQTGLDLVVDYINSINAKALSVGVPNPDVYVAIPDWLIEDRDHWRDGIPNSFLWQYVNALDGLDPPIAGFFLFDEPNQQNHQWAIPEWFSNPISSVDPDRVIRAASSKPLIMAFGGDMYERDIANPTGLMYNSYPAPYMESGIADIYQHDFFPVKRVVGPPGTPVPLDFSQGLLAPDLSWSTFDTARMGADLIDAEAMTGVPLTYGYITQGFGKTQGAAHRFPEELEARYLAWMGLACQADSIIWFGYHYLKAEDQADPSLGAVDRIAKIAAELTYLTDSMPNSFAALGTQSVTLLTPTLEMDLIEIGDGVDFRTLGSVPSGLSIHKVGSQWQGDSYWFALPPGSIMSTDTTIRLTGFKNATTVGYLLRLTDLVSATAPYQWAESVDSNVYQTSECSPPYCTAVEWKGVPQFTDELSITTTLPESQFWLLEVKAIPMAADWTDYRHAHNAGLQTLDYTKASNSTSYAVVINSGPYVLDVISVTIVGANFTSATLVDALGGARHPSSITVPIQGGVFMPRYLENPGDHGTGIQPYEVQIWELQ